MNDVILLRGVERIVIAGGAIFFGYLGYRLYVLGVDKGRSKFEAKSQIMGMLVSGVGPGLIFMGYGAIVLVVGLTFGGGDSTRITPFDRQAPSAASAPVAKPEVVIDRQVITFPNPMTDPGGDKSSRKSPYGPSDEFLNREPQVGDGDAKPIK